MLSDYMSKTGQPLEAIDQIRLEAELHRLGVRTLAGYALPLEPEHAARLLARVLKGKAVAESSLHAAADALVPKFSIAFRHAFYRAKVAARHALAAGKKVDPTPIKLALGSVLPGLLMQAVIAGGQAALDGLKLNRAASLRMAADGPFRMRFDGKNAVVIKWAKEHAGELIVDIFKVTHDRIKKASEDFQEEGDWKKYHDSILAAVGDEDRADLIARHETMLAAGEGQRQGWDQAIKAGMLDDSVQRVWITTPDERLCPICQELDSKTAPLGGEYPGGFDGPPAHVQCRCTEGIQ